MSKTVEINGADWKQRALLATWDAGVQEWSRLGHVLLSVFGKAKHVAAPRFDGTATITREGHVLCAFIGRDGRMAIANIGTFEELVKNFRGLADMLKLADPDRVAMFAALQTWIEHDNRPQALKDAHEKMMTTRQI